MNSLVRKQSCLELHDAGSCKNLAVEIFFKQTGDCRLAMLRRRLRSTPLRTVQANRYRNRVVIAARLSRR